MKLVTGGGRVRVGWPGRWVAVVLLGSAVTLAAVAETCTTQSAMQPAQRDQLAAAALTFAQQIQTNDGVAIRTSTIAQYQADFAGLAGLIAATAPRLKAGPLEVEQVYLLDASSLAKTGADAQFFCSLNKTQAEAQFTIPQLPPGVYGFAMVKVANAAPWRVSLLMQQVNGRWLLAGLYPKPLLAGNHDGLWYWREARSLAAKKEPWNAWLYFAEARSLLQPAGFVASTHLDKLDAELTAAAPPAVATLSVDQPLVLKGADGMEYRFTSLATDDALGRSQVDVMAHIKVDALGDNAAAQKRNHAAAAALVAAHPELRQAFAGVEVLTDVAGQGQQPFATEETMADLH